ncbi:MAG: DUF2523 domain-containing protein [Magnetococcales bacterium]|nr:DUF2523 domain-containing protein [Magnetococcales bacterium]
MGEWLESIWNTMLSFYDWIVWFFGTGIIEFFTSANQYFIGNLTVWYYEILTWSVELVDDRIFAIFSGISYQSDVVYAWGFLPNEVIQTLTFFRIPESVALITGAYGTRFIIGLIPFVR